jgi:hypothetical protein
VHLVLSPDPGAPRGNDSHLPPEQEERVSANMGAWLMEGVASYVSAAVSPRVGIPVRDMFLKGDNSTVDAEAKEWLLDKRGVAVLAYVGSRGTPENLLSDRKNVAAPFYLLSQSFVKYMAARLGTSAVAQLYTEHFNGTSAIEDDFRRITGKDLSKVRTDWLDLLRGLR